MLWWKIKPGKESYAGSVMVDNESSSCGVALEGSLERNEELGLGKAEGRLFQEEETGSARIPRQKWALHLWRAKRRQQEVARMAGVTQDMEGDDGREASRRQATRAFSVLLTATISHWSILGKKTKWTSKWRNTGKGEFRVLDGVIEIIENIKD